MEEVRRGEVKILMISVERLKNERFRQFISQIPISLLVVDEAHCISEWGHNFRPDYLKLPQYLKEFQIPQALLLTATATQSVIEDMRDKFSIAQQDLVVTGFYRANLDISVVPCEEDDKADQLINLIGPEPNAPTVVYVTLQQTAETVAKQLLKGGVNAHAYHAGMKPEVRESIQDQFMRGEIDCIVATIAFGMGVDKSDIRRVIHFDLPKSIENYAQEIGRAGRDGKPSQCILLANQNGLSTLENFVYGDTPELGDIHSVLKQAIENTPQWEVVLSRLSTETNIRQLPLKTLLVTWRWRVLYKPSSVTSPIIDSNSSKTNNLSSVSLIPLASNLSPLCLTVQAKLRSGVRLILMPYGITSKVNVIAQFLHSTTLTKKGGLSSKAS